MKKSMNMGGSIVSKNILEKKGRLKWCFRENGVNEIDNGWRFLSEIDNDEYLKNAANMVVCDWGTIFEIEPAILPIFDMPVGTDLTLVYEGQKKYFIFTDTGEKCVFGSE
ncbi:MAG: immunity protein Imm33 domain-containing protein [Roseburia sp. 1XD42-69]|jgi:Uncharacterized protein conserved in bacteria